MDPRFDDTTSTGTLAGFGPPTERFETSRREPPTWLQEARSGLSGPGRYVAYEQDGEVKVVPVSREWTRIGRSLAADIRFDDATVSRRHALIAVEEHGVRVLDDRSLNGIQVNGRRVEWSPLADGDEILIGRHTVYFMDTTKVTSPAEPAAVHE
ncbi:FHA domain-containing protein [Solirubrobacter sp. CPCC 204708]|uniref:FHA domain-containing protein n=1 Tax=Solirubrobacter deserti TaxID=2282478 RepID=A0ABT4RT61_9ACTN|nr:FHA domain-containing protein [Solirubrobacter deserti]MBE2318450.1 FHA domain-containing protein [Solirubrobacter deserti]MDA0141776.1 FHA domain-containing protein [Solirubrobacter deserti]